MKQFIDSTACRSHRFCQQCRTSPEWRATIVAAGMVQELDFACPNGYDEANLPIRGLGDVVHAAALPIARALKLPCIDPKTQQLRPESGCEKRRRELNRITS